MRRIKGPTDEDLLKQILLPERTDLQIIEAAMADDARRLRRALILILTLTLILLGSALGFLLT